MPASPVSKKKKFVQETKEIYVAKKQRKSLSKSKSTSYLAKKRNDFSERDMPGYLGIFPKNKNQALDDIEDYVKDLLKYITNKYPDDDDAYDCFTDLNKEMDLVKDPHLTSFYLGNNKKKL